MTTVVLVRHGESEANTAHVFAGHNNAPLTEAGRRQAEETAAELDRRFRFDCIYTSDLQRARDTAAPIAKRQGLTPISEPDFREIDVGEWAGVKYAEMPTRYPETYGMWQNDLYRCRPDGGEPMADMVARVWKAFDRVVAENRGKTILIASHANPVKTLTARAHGYPPEGISKVPWSRNASVTVIEIEDDGTMRVAAENEYCHMSPAAHPQTID